MKRRLLLRVGLVVMLLLGVGCDGFDAGQLVPSIGGATAAPQGSPAATDIADTSALTLTPVVGVTGEVIHDATPTPITLPLAAAPTEWENLAGWLAGIWRGNANPANVRAALQASGMQRSPDDWRAADFDGDLQDEWVVVLYDPSLPGVPFGSPGDLWIVNGNGAVFRYYTAPSSDIYEFLAPTIVQVADMTGDGLPELITDASICGAHTCYNNYRVIGLRDGQFVDLVTAQPSPEEINISGTPITMSYADTRLEDVDGDGLPELLVHGGTIGSAGAGIMRPRTEVWGWDGAAVTLAETILDPTVYRHHILYEANDRMAAGDLDGALALYEAAINDGALRDDGYAYTPEQTRADISAFAAFRLILTDLLQGNAERANSRLAWLGATYPGSAATGAAAMLVDGWAGRENADPLCDRIETDLSALEKPAGVLADMGYGNPSLGAGEFCPSMNVDE